MNLGQYFQWVEEIPWLSSELWGNTAARWLLALVVVSLAFISLKIVIGFVKRRVKRITATTSTGWDDGIAETMQATKNWFLLLIAIYAGALILDSFSTAPISKYLSCNALR
jgi:hypothetical protein